MKLNLTAAAKKEVNGYRPQVVVRCEGMKPFTRSAKLHFSHRQDALEFARKEVEAATMVGQISW